MKLIRKGPENMKEKAIKALRKEFRKMYSKENQKRAEFFGDTSDRKTYTWKFKLDGRIVELIYVYKTGIIVRCVKNIMEVTI